VGSGGRCDHWCHFVLNRLRGFGVTGPPPQKKNAQCQHYRDKHTLCVAVYKINRICCTQPMTNVTPRTAGTGTSYTASEINWYVVPEGRGANSVLERTKSTYVQCTCCSTVLKTSLTSKKTFDCFRRAAFQENLFAVMRFMKERKLNKKTQSRVTVYHNVLWEAYRSTAAGIY